MTIASRARTLVLPALLFLLAPPVAAASGDDNRDWNSAPASDIHARMIEGKIAAAERNAALREMIAAEAASTQTNYDMLFYDVFIRVNDTNEIVYGRVRFVAQAAQDNVGAVEVDLFNNMTIDSIVAPSGALAYTRLGNVVTINLGASYMTGDPFEFDFYYRGHPTEQAGFGAFEFTYVGGYRCISSLSEPYFARTWWPCKDRMDDKADSFNIAIEVDTAFYVGSNGTLDSAVQRSANSHVFHYSVRYPMATYLMSVAIGPYIVWNDEWVYNGGADTMPIVHAVFPNWYDYSLTGFSVTPGALSVFSDVFGQYPFDQEKYGHSLFSWGGAMEHQTMSSMESGTFGMSTPVIVHEMAHQWWGDMITCESWRDIWLNEGWASYAEAIYYEAMEGRTSYINYMLGMQYWWGGTIYCQDTSSVGSIFSSRVYDKGAWAIHMLRGVLGDSVFFACVDAYYNSQYQHKWVTTEEFKEVFETTSGRDLDWFFNEWIYGAYFPVWNWYWTTEAAPGGGTDIYVRVKQVQTSTATTFTMPVTFVVAGANDTLTAWVDEKNERVKLHTDGSFGGLAFDPMHWILDSTKSFSWTMFVVSQRDELSAGEQYVDYLDTIRVKGGSVNRSWTVVAGGLPNGLTLTNQGTIIGIPLQSGDFAFTVRVQDLSFGYIDQVDFVLTVAPSALLPGDYTADSAVNIGDLTAFVAYLFQGGPPPSVWNQADVDRSCDLKVTDLTYFVNYLFRAGPAPLWGCVD